MGADLAILVPSRRRPENVGRLVEACLRTCQANIRLHFGFDTDDPDLEDNLAQVHDPHVMATIQPRMGLTGWTNTLAEMNTDAPYLASIGDDMLPVTDGWDVNLITAVEHMGGGFAYPNDYRRDDIPEAVVLDTRIVRALGWMALPILDHWFIDDVWAALGKGAGCLQYCPDVVVRHLHPNVTGQPGDQTYSEAAHRFNGDNAVYRKWRTVGVRVPDVKTGGFRTYRMPDDVATVKVALHA